MYFQVGTGNEKVQMNLGTQEKSNQSPDKKKKDEEEKSSNITIIGSGNTVNNDPKDLLIEQAQEKDEEEKSSNITIIGVVIALILLILIALAAFLYKRKYSQVPQTDPAK